MRAEDYDWAIYHVITRAKGCTVEDICEMSSYSLEIVEESLNRLSKQLLIEYRGDLYRACSIEHFMISNQMKHDPLSQIIIENGVVKVRDPGNKKKPGDSGREV
ncbi:MAG: hypothetical protein CVV33_04070 [Methanomicrobiales archaeon HGW-Methanomicrobiales-4]|nr:MAG: hypothetical protein CVV33_04070 [Methanomicrobiales archaeon HGW-Methanomicrobiales-4]